MIVHNLSNFEAADKNFYRPDHFAAKTDHKQRLDEEICCKLLLAQSLQDKLTHQKQLRDLECRCNAKWRELFDVQDVIDLQREELIGKIEKQLQHTSAIQTLFTIRWTLR